MQKCDLQEIFKLPKPTWFLSRGFFFSIEDWLEMFGNGSAVSVPSPGSVVSGAALSELQARLEGWDKWIGWPGDGLMIACNIQRLQRLKNLPKVSGGLGNAPKNSGLVDFECSESLFRFGLRRDSCASSCPNPQRTSWRCLTLKGCKKHRDATLKGCKKQRSLMGCVSKLKHSPQNLVERDFIDFEVTYSFASI